jgi:L,D-peptidoglycan transpeptidase YkuD (ErfK/YbiS/YcfS/YnhG family)/NADPH-dependent 7-cyano-7-deazaguanine reductase QueF-like protein
MSGLTVPAAAATGSGLPLQEYVNDGAGGHLWNAYDQTQDALGPDVTGRPSAITYGATVQVFVQSDTGDLMSWVNDDQGGHLWNAYDLSSLAGSGAPIYANPDAVVNGATVDVFAESDAGDLVEYANDGVGGRLWNAYDLSSLAAGGGPVQGDASAFFEGGVPYVFVRASNGDLTEYADSASGANPWTATDLSTLAAGGGLVTGDPSALDQSGTFDVFVRSPSGSLTQYVDVAGTWSTDELTTSANGGTSVESNPAAIVYGSTIHVYVTSSTGDLTEYANGGSDSSTWTAYDLSELAGGGGPIGTDPAAVLYGGTVVHVYAGGTNTCPANVANQLANTGLATQLITVDAPSYSSTTATLTAWQLEGGCWQTVFGPSTARVGTAGVSDHKQEGDGTTPTGAYSIGSTMYGVDPNPGVSYAYHQLVCGDWWDEDPSTPDYNTFQHVACGTNPPFGGDSEALWTTVPAYDYFAVIDYNDNPIVSGAGSAIFLHVDTGSPTAGCVSIPVSELTAVLDWLSPAANPLIVIGTDAEIRYF